MQHHGPHDIDTETIATEKLNKRKIKAHSLFFFSLWLSVVGAHGWWWFISKKVPAA